MNQVDLTGQAQRAQSKIKKIAGRIIKHKSEALSTKSLAQTFS
jgi:hypothetical protein